MTYPATKIGARGIRGCAQCGYQYEVGRDFWGACPRCRPEQPVPVGVAARSPKSDMGPGWVWDEARGAAGLWTSKRFYPAGTMFLPPRFYDPDGGA